MRSTTCFTVLIFLLLIAERTIAVPVTSGLIGYWPANGNGSDLSGFGRDMTLNGGLGFSGGLVGQAFDFPNDNARFAARTIDDAAFDFGTSDFTLQVWANFSSIAGEHTLLEKFTGASGSGWTLTQRAGPSLHFYAMGSAILETGLRVPVAGFNVDAWHNILVRRSGNVFALFFDGNVIKTNPNANPNIETSQPLRTGNRQGSQVFPMRGRIDEVAIWNRALTDSEVSTIFNATVPEPTSPSLAALAIAFFVKRRRHRNRVRIPRSISVALRGAQP